MEGTSLEIRWNDRSGRGLYATRDYKEGEVVLSEKSMVSATNWENDDENHCQSCFRPLEYTRVFLADEGIKQFTKDLGTEKYSNWKAALFKELHISKYNPMPDPRNPSITYCSEECSHDGPKLYPHLEPSKFNIWQNFIESHLEKALTNPVDYSILKVVSLLCSQIEKDHDLWTNHISRLVYSEEGAKKHHTLKNETIRIQLASIYPSLSETVLSHENFGKMMSMVYLNAFCVETRSLAVILKKEESVKVDLVPDAIVKTSSMYKIGSLFNHSCDPNLGGISPLQKTEIKWAALKPIKAGEQIFNSYVPTTDDVNRRRAVLKSHYRFLCDCPKCQAELASPSL